MQKSAFNRRRFIATVEKNVVPRKRALVVYNPAAGSGSSLLEPCLKRLAAHGTQFDLHQTKGPGDGEKFVREAALKGSYDAVAAAGGDGAINEVANGLLGTALPMGIIPLGTVNVLALELGHLIKDPESAARSIAFGPARAVHVGSVNGRRFLLMVGAGFDGRAVAGVSSKLKNFLGRGAYIAAGLKELFFRSPAELAVDADGSQHQASWVVISNGSLYAGKFLLAPETNLESPGFGVSLVSGKTRWVLFRALMEMGLNRKAKSVWTRMDSVNRITVTSARDEPAQMDGDAFGLLPLTITSSPQSLEIIMPCSDL